MSLSEEKKQAIADLKSVYDSIQFHGIYTKYTRSISVLSKFLRLEDPSELHYVMMHLSRLSYLKDVKGIYLWGSERYLQLLGCNELSHLISSTSGDFLDEYADSELQKMETHATQLQQISTNLIDAYLKGRGHFTSHAKIYPVYAENGSVIGSLALLVEVVSHESPDFIPVRESGNLGLLV